MRLKISVVNFISICSIQLPNSSAVNPTAISLGAIVSDISRIDVTVWNSEMMMPAKTHTSKIGADSSSAVSIVCRPK